MAKYSRSLVILSSAFLLIMAILFAMNIQIQDACSHKPFMLYKLFFLISLIMLYALTLFLFVKDIKYSQNMREQLQKKLTGVTDTLNDVQSSLDDAVEKKTFEMSVINGSLNREIAERIQAEAESIKLRNRFHAILNSAGEGIYGINTKGTVTFVNKRATELLGWEKDELIGRSLHDLTHHTHKSGTKFPVEECPIYMAYKDGDIHFESDDIFWKKNGRSFPVEYTSTPLIDGDEITGAVVVFKDISKAVKLQKQLELILNSTGEGIFGLDVSGKVTFMNKAASIMLGWTQKELIDKSHHELVHHSYADGSVYHEEDCPIFMACKDGQVHFKSDDIFWAKDGSSFTVEYSSTPIFEGKKLTGTVVMFRDMTTFS